MATPNPGPDQAHRPAHRLGRKNGRNLALGFAVNPATRPHRRALVLIVVLVVAAFVWFWKPLNGYAKLGSAYGARVACSCHYLGGRSLSDCHKDFEPGMELITLSDDRETKSVTARFPLLASQTATYREGEGCQLEPWRE